MERQIANAHVFFTVSGVMLLIGFTSTAVCFLKSLIPEWRAEEKRILS